MTPGGKSSFTNPIKSYHRYSICGDFRMSAPLLTASRHRIRLKIALQKYRRKGGLQMSENQYDAPAMEVVEFDKEDIITESGGEIIEGF